MDSFLLLFLTQWLQNPSPGFCCWQPSPGSVSPLLGTAQLSLLSVNSLFYSLSGLRGRRWGGAAGTSWSQYSGMCLGKPRVDTAPMTGRESSAGGSRGTPLLFPSLNPCPSPVVLSVSAAFVSRAPVSHKGFFHPRRHINVETVLFQAEGAWKTAKPTSLYFCCCWQAAAKRPLWALPCPICALKREKKTLQTAGLWVYAQWVISYYCTGWGQSSEGPLCIEIVYQKMMQV